MPESHSGWWGAGVLRFHRVLRGIVGEVPWAGRLLLGGRFPKKFEWIDVEVEREAFDGAKAEVAEALLDAADVGAVVAEALGELLLAESLLLAVRAEVAPERSL